MSTMRKTSGGTPDLEGVAANDPDGLAAIARTYTLVDRPLVRRFLEDHAQVVPVLLSAVEPIARYFPSAERHLQVIHDPDAVSSGDTDTLYLYIATMLKPEEAMDRLDRLEEEWWPTVGLQVQAKLCLDLSFV